MPPRKKTSQPEKVSFPEQLLITIPEAATRLSTTKWAVYSLLWAKKVPYIKIGRRHLIDPKDLVEFIQREKRAAA